MSNISTICIDCKPIFAHHWMAFLSWYSIHTNLPNVEVILSCPQKINLFNWASKLKIPLVKKLEYHIITPDIVALQDQPILDVLDIKCQDFGMFYNYSNWGNFKLEDWLSVEVCPFNRLRRFIKKDMSINEQKLVEIWKNAKQLYSAVG